ncbi:MAG: hypothetical protein RSF02_03235 [Bacilli bacterium]
MDINEKLKRLKKEDFIWIIYIFIVIFALYANNESRMYLKTNNRKYNKQEKKINILVFFIAFFIYLYFVLLLTKDLSNMEQNFNNPKYRDTCFRLIAALLFLIGGSIYLYVEVKGATTDEVGLL